MSTISLDQETSVIDWINTLEIPSCSLVNSISDIQSGAIPLEILSYLQSEKHPKNFPSNQKQATENWSIFLKNLPESISRKYSIEVLSNPSHPLHKKKLIDVINYLISLSSPSFFQPGQNKAFFSIDLKPVLDWLTSLKFSPDLTEEEIIRSCSLGILYADVINKLEEKEVIKGIDRKPETRTKALSNLAKSLFYLKNQQRMKSSFLWAGKEIIQGKPNFIFGLLFDIKTLYKRAIAEKTFKNFTKTQLGGFYKISARSVSAKMYQRTGSFLKYPKVELRKYSNTLLRRGTISSLVDKL